MSHTDNKDGHSVAQPFIQTYSNVKCFCKDTSDFIGCFSHSSGNYSSNKKTRNNLMHVQLCIDFCYKSNFSLAALTGIEYEQ